MRPKLITVIPVYNGGPWIGQTLESVAQQTVKPDRLVVTDNCSTDNTEEVVRNFKGMPVEYRRNERDLGGIVNANFGLKLASETEYLHELHADDLICPEYYEVMIKALETCEGRGMAFCLDERIDEKNERLSLSGKPTGTIDEFTVDEFLSYKAQIGNQACSGTFLKTAYQPNPCEFRAEFPILCDVVLWAEWGSACKRIVRVNRPLVKYRWHGSNATSLHGPNIDYLVGQEWRVMQMIEQRRTRGMTPYRHLKLKGLYAVRSNIKAKRFKEQGNPSYSRQIAELARGQVGLPFWCLARILVETRDVLVYGLMGRRKHPKNIYG